MTVPLRAHPGALLAGKYRVDQVLGVGAMGVVVAAIHLHLGQRVAVKLMRPELTGNRELVQRFLMEARAAARLKSARVCRILDVDACDDGTPYIVMEYLEGSDLATVRQSFGQVPVCLAADFILQACEALAEAHALGIVHRDLKPANLFATRGPGGETLVKVLDFGLAKSADLGMTRTAIMLGSPAYSSPEQLRCARDADARSDIWSLGIILYELVVGYRPFRGETMSELCLRITTEPPAALPTLRGLARHARFAAVIRRCLEKVPENRYAHVGELAADLARFGPRKASVRPARPRICR